MYGPKWPFLLMYGSHVVRQTGFSRVDGLSTDPPPPPPVLGHHISRMASMLKLGNPIDNKNTKRKLKFL